MEEGFRLGVARISKTWCRVRPWQDEALLADDGTGDVDTPYVMWQCIGEYYEKHCHMVGFSYVQFGSKSETQ